MADRRPQRGRHEGDQLSAFLDDELADDEALEVARHLDHCDSCLAELDDIRAARSVLRDLPHVAPPPDVFVTAASAGATSRRRRRRRVRAVSLALATLTAVGAAGFVAGADRGTVMPPVEMFVVEHVTRVGGGPVLTPVDLQAPAR